MLQTELLALVAHGRNSRVEFMRVDIEPEQLARELVAMAGRHGGRVLLGVNVDGSIRGVYRSDLEDWVMNTVYRRYVRAITSLLYEEVLLPDGKRVAILTVAGTAQPYMARHESRENIYLRISPNHHRATAKQFNTTANHAGHDTVAAV